jgi:hypothetical protein
MKLGKALNMITPQFLDLDRWDELLSIRYAFESHKEKGDVLNDYRNDMKGGGVKMKAGHRFLKKKATYASYDYNKVKNFEKETPEYDKASITGSQTETTDTDDKVEEERRREEEYWHYHYDD